MVMITIILIWANLLHPHFYSCCWICLFVHLLISLFPLIGLKSCVIRIRLTKQSSHLVRGDNVNDKAIKWNQQISFNPIPSARTHVSIVRSKLIACLPCFTDRIKWQLCWWYSEQNLARLCTQLCPDQFTKSYSINYVNAQWHVCQSIPLPCASMSFLSFLVVAWWISTEW